MNPNNDSFDILIEDTPDLQKIAHLELYPSSLSWNKPWYWLINEYNDTVDMNEDCMVNILDVVQLVNIILN